jgi:hypothetical protein
VVAQWLFGRGHAALGGQYEDLVLHRNLALLLFLVAAGLVVWLCRSTRDWPVPAPRRVAAGDRRLAAAAALLSIGSKRYRRGCGSMRR